jgi:hypothetical protein
MLRGMFRLLRVLYGLLLGLRVRVRGSASGGPTWDAIAICIRNPATSTCSPAMGYLAGTAPQQCLCTSSYTFWNSAHTVPEYQIQLNRTLQLLLQDRLSYHGSRAASHVIVWCLLSS